MCSRSGHSFWFWIPSAQASLPVWHEDNVELETFCYSWAVPLCLDAKNQLCCLFLKYLILPKFLFLFPRVSLDPCDSFLCSHSREWCYYLFLPPMSCPQARNPSQSSGCQGWPHTINSAPSSAGQLCLGEDRNDKFYEKENQWQELEQAGKAALISSLIYRKALVVCQHALIITISNRHFSF